MNLIFEGLNLLKGLVGCKLDLLFLLFELVFFLLGLYVDLFLDRGQLTKDF